jgi:hypothetical protein
MSYVCGSAREIKFENCRKREKKKGKRERFENSPAFRCPRFLSIKRESTEFCAKVGSENLLRAWFWHRD